ncbi:uncharacterized protein IUM83_00588 [Phytophthora cinnamomi]|uniref:uncharacterized protein n=1 Tax=Phytophthora cinnamomi TaxID=4785 RepID=UPI003559EC21|nr:hypothetical protein IUM83_00588 [Phytophthora cinnamomi]
MEGVAAAWSSWSCADVGRWLGAQGFQEHVELFAANKISGSILPELTRNALRDDLGIAAFGDRVRIAQAIEALVASSASPAAAAPSTTASAPGQAWLPRDENALDLVVLHAAPLVIKDSRHRIYPMEKLDLEAERREISNSLLTDVQHKAIHVRFDIATADILRSLMTAWKCTVLHFSGHGLGQRAALCFEDGAGCTHLITPDALRQLMFSGHAPGERQVPGATPVEVKRGVPPEAAAAVAAVAGPKPLDGNVKLVFVNACHSQKVASVFLNAGIPHVVAVHSDSLVVDASATMFAKHFYLSLFHGHTVSTAFEIAKGAVRALPTQKRAACCCAHLHEPTCTWMRDGSRHSQHSATQCCCKGHVLPFPHDESSKFLLLGTAPHDVVLFGDIPNGSLRDYTPRYPSNIPSMHGQFIGRNTETYLMVKSLRENAVTACLGAPGIGKSSLIISVAHFVHSRRLFPDGVFYVDLEGQKLSTVRYAIAQSIGMPAADTDEEVFAELGTKNCLLVLDKVEELLDEDENKGEELLHQLISVAPNLKLLLASRRNMHIPSVTPYSLSISELPLHTATELLCLVAPGCSAKLAERLARICGCLPLAIRVVGRALANARMTVTPERMIEYLERDEHRFETIRELNQVGHKDFEIEAAEAVLSSVLMEQNAAGKLTGSSSYSLMSSSVGGSAGATTSTSSSSSSTYFPADAYAKSSRSRNRDDDVSSSLKIREITLGENHPQVAQSLNNLALYLSNQLETQELSEAELATQRAEIGRLYERALRIRRSRLGNASFETAATLNNMGNFKRLTKDWRGAEENIKEALQITDRYFNDISPRAARIFINLARVYRDQKRYGDAIAAYKKAQDIRQQLFPDTGDVGYCIEQIGKCLRLQGKEEEGKILEDRGRQMKKLGHPALEQDEIGEVDSGSTISGASNGFQHTVLSGDSVEGPIASGHLFARVNVYDIVDAEALISRKFNFPGKLIGERGIHLKKIEAISCAQLRYFGPWPQSLTKRSKGRGDSQRETSPRTMPEAYIQITSTNEAALERAKEQSTSSFTPNSINPAATIK